MFLMERHELKNSWSSSVLTPFSSMRAGIWNDEKLIPNQYYGKVLDYSKASGKAAIIKALEHLTSDKVKKYVDKDY